MISPKVEDCNAVSELVPSCGINGCTDDLCGVGPLTPIGSLSYSIWSKDGEFPIHFSLTDGVYPKEWKLPTLVDGEKLLANLLASLRTNDSDAEIVPFNFQLSERRNHALISSSSKRSSSIPVIIKPLSSYMHHSRDSSSGVSYANLILMSPPPSCSKNRAIRAWWKRLGGRFAPDCTHHMPQETKHLSYCQVLKSPSCTPGASSLSPVGASSRT